MKHEGRNFKFNLLEGNKLYPKTICLEKQNFLRLVEQFSAFFEVFLILIKSYRERRGW